MPAMPIRHSRTTRFTRSALPIRPERRLPTLIAALLGALLLIVGAATGATRSEAAVDGVMVSYGGWTVGTRQLDTGEFVYCIEPGALTPAGPQLEPGEVDELRGYSFLTFNVTGWAGVASSDPISGEPLRRINYVISEYGGTTDPREAVAVQFAIWLLRDAPGEAAWLAHHTAWVETHGGADEIARARALADEARALAHPSTAPAAPVGLRIEPGDSHDTGIVAYPAGTVELRITGAVFADGTDTFTAPTGEAGIAEWRAPLHRDGWRAAHEVRVTGTWELEATGWPARVRVYPALLPAEQTLAWAVGPVTEPASGSFADEARWIDSTFAPTLTTRVVQQLLGEHDRFADTVTLGLVGQPGGSGEPAPWPNRAGTDGQTEWLPLVLEGTLYGPFAEEQQIAAAAPDGAPVAGRIQLLADRGPGGYTVMLPDPPSESGHYYWVWVIDARSGQAAAELLPDGYRFADEFGLPDEMHVVTMPVPQAPEPAQPSELGPVHLAQTGTAVGAQVAPALGIGALALGAGALLITGAVRQGARNMQGSCSRRR